MTLQLLSSVRKKCVCNPVTSHWRPKAREMTGPFACVVLVLIMSTISPGFLSFNNFANIFSQSSILFVLALGQMLVIITRGFDISVGAVAALSSVVAVQAVAPFGEFNAIILGIGTGLVVGAINGYLIACQGLQPIIVTLGTTLVARGLATALVGDVEVISLPPDSVLQSLGYSWLMHIPSLIWIASGAGLLIWAVTKRLPFGRWLFMVGGNPEAANLVGVPVRTSSVIAYSLCGGLAGLAGMFLLSRSGSAVAIEGAGMELQAIAACVIGGIALSGGTGSVWQALIGAVFIQALLNGLNLLGASPFVSEMVLGVVLVSAGALDFIVRKFH